QFTHVAVESFANRVFVTVNARNTGDFTGEFDQFLFRYLSQHSFENLLVIHGNDLSLELVSTNAAIPDARALVAPVNPGSAVAALWRSGVPGAPAGWRLRPASSCLSSRPSRSASPRTCAYRSGTRTA